MSPGTHVILGAGPVGLATARALTRRGEEPIVVSRTVGVSVPSGARHRAGDVLDPSFLESTIAPGAVVYQALNAPYHRWRQDLPPLQRAVVGRCRRASARLVSFENMYMYGAPGGSPLGEDAPHRPCSIKGRVRSEMALELARAREAGTLEVIQVRASDLFGPGVHASALGDEVFGRIAQALAPRVAGDPDAPHSWTYVEDCAQTLVAAALHPDPPPVIHVPSEPPVSARDVVALASALSGRPITLRVTPTWVLRLLGIFDPLIRELPEMIYEFDRPFVVADTVARGQLGLTSTPFEVAVARTLEAFGVIRATA
ncbi:MAG TPA: NAD-dependent epimerase/dehydratase family protein [Deltaproteobacteria bacterium]|nr:NAD-dependent epimerase/dehydratase family protein [Deltaproteobacteria bacterium]